MWLYVSVRDTPRAKEDQGMMSPARTKIYSIAQLLVWSLASAWALHLAPSRAVHLKTHYKRLQESHSMSFRTLCALKLSQFLPHIAEHLGV